MSDIRKVIIELKTNPKFKQAQRNIFDKLESIEGLELFKIDFLRNYTLMLTEIKMKKGYTLNDAEIPPEAEILSILENKGTTYIVLMKLRPYIELDSIVKKFDINAIWDSPLKVTEDRRIYSAIADKENIDKLLSAIQFIGKIEKTIFQKPSYGIHGLLSSLTARQKEILILAKKMGYYEYPRKINSENLANILGISKAATIEHLRKAEVKIMSNLLAGY